MTDDELLNLIRDATVPDPTRHGRLREIAGRAWEWGRSDPSLELAELVEDTRSEAAGLRSFRDDERVLLWRAGDAALELLLRDRADGSVEGRADLSPSSAGVTVSLGTIVEGQLRTTTHQPTDDLLSFVTAPGTHHQLVVRQPGGEFRTGWFRA